MVFIVISSLSSSAQKLKKCARSFLTRQSSEKQESIIFHRVFVISKDPRKLEKEIDTIIQRREDKGYVCMRVVRVELHGGI